MRYPSKEILSYQALITGDPHHENFSHIFSNGERVFVLNDIDDVGVGPAYLDLLKFLGVARSINKDEDELSSKKVIEAYIEGLREKYRPYDEVAKDRLPKLLKDDYEVGSKEFWKMYQKKNKKDAPNGLFSFDKNDDLTLWDQMSNIEQMEFQQMEASLFLTKLMESLSDYQIYDRAEAEKGTGGSRGLTRFVFSLLNPASGDQQIIEFKPINTTALEAYPIAQPSALERSKLAFSIYWPSDYPNEFAILGEGNSVFLMRPKYKKLVDFKTKDLAKDEKEFAELTEFIGYFLGQKHGIQMENSSVYADSLEDGLQGDLLKRSQNLIEDYLDEVKKLQD